jgi:hypothetical protein
LHARLKVIGQLDVNISNGTMRNIKILEILILRKTARPLHGSKNILKIALDASLLLKRIAAAII